MASQKMGAFRHDASLTKLGAETWITHSGKRRVGAAKTRRKTSGRVHKEVTRRFAKRFLSK